MIVPGEIISYNEMCLEEGVNLQRGMNFGLGQSYSIILMSQRKNAPYEDEVLENGKFLFMRAMIYLIQKILMTPKSMISPCIIHRGH